MIQQGTKLNIIDNSGGKTARCIKVLGGSFNRSASLGEIIVVSIQKSYPSSAKNKRPTIRPKEVHQALIVSCKKEVKRGDGTVISFGSNDVIIINEQGQPLGTRIFGPIPFEVDSNKYSKVYALSPYTI